uniref:RRP15-like protein n=1 Tax=Strongyloides venezuelensis TaxID=75913 RepID=A0A0K0F269_STRVS
MSLKRKASEIEIEEEDDEIMMDDFGSDDDGDVGIKNTKSIDDDENDDSEDSAQYDEDESEEETSSDEEGVVPNSNMRNEKMKVVQFDSVKALKRKEKLAKASMRLTKREMVEKKREKIAHLKLGMVKPNYVKDRTKERNLAKIASFGVATLFNQVLDYKKQIIEDAEVKKEVKNIKLDRKYKEQLDALPRTANRFIVRPQKGEQKEEHKEEV